MLDAVTSFPVIGGTLEEQLALEREMVDGGMARFVKQEEAARKRGDGGVGSRYLMRRLHQDTAAGVRDFILLADSGAPGRAHTSLPYLIALGADHAAFLALRSVLNEVMTKQDAPTLQALSSAVGITLETELWMRNFEESKPDLYKLTERELHNHTADRQRHSIARKMAKKAGTPGGLPPRDRLLLGLKMVRLIQERTGVIETVLSGGGKHAIYRVILSEQARERCYEVAEAAKRVTPYYLPTVIPPRPWTSTRAGGYHADHRGLTLIKSWRREASDQMDGADISEVLRAVNTVQATPWKINRPVLDVLSACFDLETSVAGLDAAEVDIPPYPANAEHDEEAKKEWKRLAAQAHDRNRRTIGRRLQIALTIDTAQRFADRDGIWFPHSFDFRGRMYPISSTLHPQGPDFMKGVLTFARGFPIVDNVAAGWLMVSGANRYGVDKCSLVDRIEWVEKHEAAILAVAKDPFSVAFEFWSKADEPFQFLAWCFEWAAFKAAGWGYVSSLPVNLDGTCNGLQHYSAALRDEVGGASVNLLPSDKPNDIYAVVAKRAEELVRAFWRGNTSDRDTLPDLPKKLKAWSDRGIDAHQMAEAWLSYGLDRKDTKRSVMTLPYGSTNYSCREFIEEAMKERLAKTGRNPFPPAPGEEKGTNRRAMFNASLWLQPFVWHAIGETVTAARRGMDWLQACARIVASDNVPVKWTAPDGFVVLQAYRSYTQRRITSKVDGAMVRLSLLEETDKIDSMAQQRAIAPNWVHSMDACALRMFVNIGEDNGLHDFSLIHDSYGTQAAHVEVMAACLREAFIRLYTENDPIADFYLSILDQVPPNQVSKVPEPPKRGSLDLQKLRSSDYFFA